MSLDDIIKALEDSNRHEIVLENGQLLTWFRELREARELTVDRWISVKDKLPEEMQDKSAKSGWSEEIRPSDSVLILTAGGLYDVAWYSYAYEDWTTDNESYSYEKKEVAFWQPLPKPPKDGDQNDKA